MTSLETGQPVLFVSDACAMSSSSWLRAFELYPMQTLQRVNYRQSRSGQAADTLKPLTLRSLAGREARASMTASLLGRLAMESSLRARAIMVMTTIWLV